MSETSNPMNDNRKAQSDKFYKALFVSLFRLSPINYETQKLRRKTEKAS